ncbi:MAG TPA: hypothetical protein PKX46_03500 [Clostridia bacterium]|nr:hypothetical protein [Clostridia bacterium]
MLLLAYDVGTSLIKATLINKEAEVISSSSIGYETLHRAPLYAEQALRPGGRVYAKLQPSL